MEAEWKKKAVKDLKIAGLIGDRVAIVGDGISELETLGETDLFIGFGAHARRQRVEEGADVFVNDPTFSVLIPFLLDSQSLTQIAANENDRGLLGEAFAALSTTRFNPRAHLLQQDLSEIEQKLALMFR